MGSSLVDAIIAASILGTGVVAMAQLFSIAAVNNVTARGRTVAMILAQQKLEELRSGDLTVSTSESIEHLTASGAIADGGSAPSSEAVYTRRWFIEPTTLGAEAEVVRVRVTIRGAGHSEIEVATIKARSGE